MKVYSFAPLPVGILPWNDPEPCVTVITKLTLAFGPGGFAVAAGQEPLCHRIPSLFGSPFELHHPSDFVPRKARCDLLLSGRAYAAIPLTAIGARVRVGSFQKRFFALAGEETTAIPLSYAYLRAKRKIDSEAVTVGALSSLHPGRERFRGAGFSDDPGVLRRNALAPDHDFSFFNSAPRDQQIEPPLPGTALSLEGLSPDGAPCNGHLPQLWPQIFALTRDGARLLEIPLVCDTLWVDTDAGICELTLRGTWGGASAPAAQRGTRTSPQLPIGLVVTLRDPNEKRGAPLLADLPKAAVSRALAPEDVEQVADPIEEVEAVEEIEELMSSSFEMDEPTTIDVKHKGIAAIAAEGQGSARPTLGRLGALELRHDREETPEIAAPEAHPALANAPAPPALVARAPAAAEVASPPTPPPEPARPPERPRRAHTLTMMHAPARPSTLPFREKPAALEEIVQRMAASRAAEPAPPSDAASQGPRRPRTLEILPGSLPRPALPFGGSDAPSPPSGPPSVRAPGPRRPRTMEIAPGSVPPKALPFAARDSAPPRFGLPPPDERIQPPSEQLPRRPRTLEISASSLPGAALPFPSASPPVPSAPQPFPNAGTPFQSANTPFQSTGTPFQSAGTPFQNAVAPPAPVPGVVAPSASVPGVAPPASVPSALVQPAPVPSPVAPTTPLSSDSDAARAHLLGLSAERPPWQAKDDERARETPAKEALPAPVIERVGLLPLSVDAAIQQEVWRGEDPLHAILARHGVDEVTWRDHLRRRDEALRDEAAQGGGERARAALSALDKARRPEPDKEEEPVLDLATYASIRAVLDDSDNEAGVLAMRGISKETWDRDHRAYRKRIREEPAMVERFRTALEEAKTALAAPAAGASGKKKPAARKLPPPPPRTTKKS